MANVKHQRLTASMVKSFVKKGFYADGEGLNLRVDEKGNKNWVQRITIEGKARSIGLGAYPAVSLAEARRVVQGNRRAVQEGRNPIEEKRMATQFAPVEPFIPTFKDAGTIVIEMRRPTWSNSRHAKQWTESLTNHAYPLIGDKRIDELTSADVLNVLTPIWTSKAETATRVQQRLVVIFDWAIAAGHRTDNPASAIVKALPRRPRQKAHHAAQPFTDVPATLTAVKNSTAHPVTKLAFEFLILTGARTGEVRGATWDEIDTEGKTWVVPATRMKARREQRVPLSGRAFQVLEKAQGYDKGSGLIFTASRKGGQLSNMVFEMLMRRLEIPAVPHGFRSSFRDWMAERTGASWAVAESALAHSSGERASLGYHRTDYLEERRPIMEAWAEFLARETA